MENSCLSEKSDSYRKLAKVESKVTPQLANELTTKTLNKRKEELELYLDDKEIINYWNDIIEPCILKATNEGKNYTHCVVPTGIMAQSLARYGNSLGWRVRHTRNNYNRMPTKCEYYIRISWKPKRLLPDKWIFPIILSILFILSIILPAIFILFF